MGGAASVSFRKKSENSRQSESYLNKSDADIVDLMMPVYYTKLPCTEEDIAIAKRTWNMILEDTCPEYLSKKGTPGFIYSSCVMFFYDTFYTRLFDVHPMARPMFKGGLKAQAKLLVKMITLSLSDISTGESKAFNERLVKLTDVHNDRGVKATEYGVVGEVLFWTMKFCLGSAVCDAAVCMAWIKIFSRILFTMVPVAVSFELKSKSASQDKRTVSVEVLNDIAALTTAAANQSLDELGD